MTFKLARFLLKINDLPVLAYSVSLQYAVHLGLTYAVEKNHPKTAEFMAEGKTSKVCVGESL